MKVVNRKQSKLSAENGKYLYEGDTITDEKTKNPIYDGPGYLFNNETKCFFKGTWKMGQKLCGIETFPNGDVYEGTYKENKFHGKGLLYNVSELTHNAKTQYRYEGEFDYGQKQGQGKEMYITGGYYEGQFMNNQKHGYGKLVFADQSYYEGDFQRGSPNGFGIQVAYSKERIVTVFPQTIRKKKSMEKGLKDQQDEGSDDSKNEFLYEGEFVDGYKHGIGRLYSPSGSYYYAYWEYNKPSRNFVQYIAKGNKWRLIEFHKYKNLQQNEGINFYEIIRKNKIPIQAIPGYPTAKVDGYKCIIDEKGLKRETFEDEEFNFSEQQFNIRDENNSLIQAPIDFSRIYTLDIYKQRKYKLLTQEIIPGYLIYQEQYCCQQLTVILNSLTFHSYLLQKSLSRKYESEIGFYFIKLFIDNEWKEYIIDDIIPIFKDTKYPVFSNSLNNELAWVILFKAIAKYYQSFTYFENDNRTIRAEEYLTLLTGMPSFKIQIPNNNVDEKYSDQQIKIWRQLSHKYQKTKIRICYLSREGCQRLILPENTAYQLVDILEAPGNSQKGDILLMLILASNNKYAIKTEYQDKFAQEKFDKNTQNTIQRLKERNPQCKDNNSYFIIEFREFLKFFGIVYMLCASKYPIHNSQLIIPEESDQYSNELRFFCRFSTNLPQDCLISVCQEHYQIKNDQMIKSEKTFPIRILLAKEKDIFSNKAQIKKKVVNNLQEKVILSKQDKEKKKIENENQNSHKFSLYEPDVETKKSNPYKYCFGRGQSTNKILFKNTSIDSGIYILFIQVEMGDAKEAMNFGQLRFIVNIYSQQLMQILKLEKQIQGFQREVYQSAISIANKKFSDPSKQNDKLFHKCDLSEQENGSSDLVITQYFIQKEGTYLQLLNNKSTNKIWRQKLYFKLENMQIIDSNDNSKLDFSLSKKQNALIIIQQIGAKKYNLEGGEGICIVDQLREQPQDDEDEEEIQVEKNSIQTDNKQNSIEVDQRKNFKDALFPDKS